MEPNHGDDAARPRRNNVVRRLLHMPLVRYAREARENDLGTHLLAISAQQLLCTAPLAVALGAVGKRLTGVSFDGVLSHLLSLTPTAKHEVSAALAGSPTVSLSALLLNLAFAIAFGVGLAAALQRGLELIWRLPRAAYLGSTVRGLIWAIALPVMISAVVLISRAGHFLRHHVSHVVVVGFVLQILAIAVFLWWTQYLLLARRVPFRKLFRSTLISTLAIAIVVVLGRQMISGQIVPAYRAYGSVGIGIVLSAWMAIASSSSSIGLAVGAWLQRRHDERTGAPFPTADRVAAESALEQPVLAPEVAAEASTP